MAKESKLEAAQRLAKQESDTITAKVDRLTAALEEVPAQISQAISRETLIEDKQFWEMRAKLKQANEKNERLMNLLESTINHQQQAIDRIAARMDGIYDMVGSFSDAFLEFHDAFDLLISDTDASKCPNCGKQRSWSDFFHTGEKADPNFLVNRESPADTTKNGGDGHESEKS